MDDIREIVSQIETGSDAEQFFKTNLGKYLVELAQHESDEVSRRLKSVNPTNVSEIVKLQIKAQVAEAALKWLGEAILQGQQAEYELSIKESEENYG